MGELHFSIVFFAVVCSWDFSADARHGDSQARASQFVGWLGWVIRQAYQRERLEYHSLRTISLGFKFTCSISRRVKAKCSRAQIDFWLVEVIGWLASATQAGGGHRGVGLRWS